MKTVDKDSLQVPENAYDDALCALGLMYVPDAVQALAGMRRALRPGSRAVAAVWGQRNRCGWAEIFPIVDARVETEVCPLFFLLGSGEVLRQAFLQSGFENVVGDRISTLLHYDTAEAALGAAFIGGPVALAHSRFDDATRTQAYAEYLRSIAPYRNGSEYDIPGEFVIVRGEKSRHEVL